VIGARIAPRRAAGVLVLLVAGCVDRVISYPYGGECVEPDCRRAVVTGIAGDRETESERLFRLARTERQQGRFDEAEALSRESIRLETGRSGEPSLELARRRLELAVDLAGQDRWSDGADVLALVIAYGPGFRGPELGYAEATYREFANKFRVLGQPDRAMLFEAAGTPR
jgi:hypothetical protein